MQRKLPSHYSASSHPSMNYYSTCTSFGNCCTVATRTTNRTHHPLTVRMSGHLARPPPFITPKLIMISGSSSPMSRTSTPSSSHRERNSSRTPPIPPISERTLNSTSTGTFPSQTTSPLTRSRKALEKKQDDPKMNTRKRKHWQSLADDPTNHNPELSKPKKRKGKTGKDVRAEARRTSSHSLECDMCKEEKKRHEKHSPMYEQEDKELWRHFDEPEWQGILDVVP